MRLSDSGIQTHSRCFVSLAYARGEFSTPVDLLNRYFLNTGWTEAVRRVGAQVTVLHRFDQNAIVERNNVRYYFVKDQYDSILDWWQVPGACSDRSERSV